MPSASKSKTTRSKAAAVAEVEVEEPPVGNVEIATAPITAPITASITAVGTSTTRKKRTATTSSTTKPEAVPEVVDTPATTAATTSETIPETIPETTAATTDVVLTTAAATTAKKSRSKKVPAVVAVVSPTGVSGSFLSEQRPLIAHIPVRSSQVCFENTPQVDELKYDPIIPEIPKPYDEGTATFSYLDGVRSGTGVGNDEPGMEIEKKDVATPSTPDAASSIPSTSYNHDPAQ